MADNEALSRMRYKANKKKKNPKETGASLLQSGSSILSSASKGKNTTSQATKTSNGKVAGVKQVSRNNSKNKKTTTPSSRQYQTALGGKKSLPIMASDAAKKAHENTMDTSPMGQLRRQGKRIQTSRTDNFSREENDSALPSGLASNLRNAQRKKNKTALSKADRKNLSKPEQLYLRSQKEAWESGQKLIERGYTEQGKQMQEEAHARAENIRRDSGYSGGDSGAGFITPEIKQDEYAGMSDAGRKNLRVAKSYYNYGKETGDKGLMDDAAEYGKAVRLDPASYDLERALAWEKKQKDVAPERLNTDGNGRTIYTPTEWDREQSEKWETAVWKGLLGGFQTLLETARKATRNAIENRNDPTYQSQKYTADYLQHKANKTTDQAEKERLNQEAAKMRETSEAFKHNDPVPWYSDGMMNLKESQDATQDLVASRKTEAGKLMTKAGLSMLQMAPFLAANVIPGAGQAISLGGMGALAAGQKAGELQMNGTGAGEALARGLVSGGIEAFTEKIPMDSLLKLVKGGGGTNFIKAVAKQAGIEATEESASYTMNWLADKAARDPNAKFSLSDLAENAAIGAISGAAFGAGGHVIGSAISAGRTPYNNPSPTEDTTPTPTVEEAPRPIQEQPTQESANPLIRASQAQEQMRTQAQEQAQANQDTRAQMQSARERLLQARQALAQREAAWQERAANATEEEVPDLLREQETLLQAERQIQAQEAQAEREDAGQLSRNFGEEAAHIDQRTAGDVSKPSVKAFQWDYPQMHQYYAQAAEALLQDVEYSKAGQFSEKGRGTVVTKSEAMMQAERMGISRADLEKALIAIINDQGQENYATAKKVELVLDEMLSKGYIPNEAGYSANKVDSQVPPNEAYITAKEAIPGAVKRGSFEAYKEQNRLALELGEITEEQLYQEWEQGQTLAQSQAQFEPQSQAQSQAQTQDTRVQSQVETQPGEKGQLTGRLLDTLRANKAAIDEGGIIARMDGTEFAPGLKRTGDQVAEFFASLGNKVTRLGFGDIALTKRGAKDSIMHGMSRNKAIAFSAVPAVIENGVVIDEQANWKGRGWDSVTFGGKIQIGEQTYDMGVIVRKYGNESPNYGRYYLHEVLLTDEDGATVPINARTLSGNPSDTATPSSMDSVAQDQGAVNEENVDWNDPGLRDSLGSARAGFDPYSQAMNRYGTIEPGENPARIVDVPKSMTGSDRVRKTARTFMEAEATSDELVEAFQEGVTQGEWSYTPKKDKDSVERSMRVLSGENGIQKGFTQWDEVVEGNRQVTKDDIVLAEMLYKMASRNGDTATAKKLAAEIAAFGTTAGQNVQAIRLLKKATPEGKLFYVQKVTDKLNADMQKRFKGKFEDIDIPDELAQKLLDADGQEEMDAAIDEIYDYVADRVPKTADMRLDAWRYFAMLGNPRTHMRNVIGNFVMQGLTRSRNATSAALQQFIVKDADQRTRTFAGSMEAHKFAKQDFLANKDLLSGNPYTTSESGIIWQKVREKAFTVDANKREKSAFWRAVNDLMKVPQTFSSANTKGLDYEDLLFKRSTYIDSLANFLTARGYKTDFENIPENVMEEARGHAIDDALEATFQEYSALASKLAQFESSNKAAKLLVGGTFPFKRVPINIAKQGIRYSPAGLLNSMTAGIKKLRNGDITGAEFCDELASGLTGTGVAALGAFLLARGILSAGGDDDDKQAGFDAAMGSQNYAINFTIGGQKYSYTIDWAAPSVVPLFIGAEFYKALKQRDEETSLSKATLDALGRMFEPMMQMTMLSGVSSTIKSAAYSQQDPIYGVLGNVASNYAGQFVPTLLGQIARTMDPVRRSTFYDANSKVPKELQRFLQRQGAKIPGLSEKMPEYLDVWGRNDMGSDNMLLRVVENFLSPGYANKVGSTKVEDELQRLNDAGYEGMLPGAVQKSGKLDGNRMTAEQWMKRQKEQGSTAYEIMQNFIGTQEYQNLTDDQKAKFIDKAYEYAKNSGKAAAGGDTSDFAKWYEAANNAQSEAGLSKERFLSLYAYKSAIEDEAPDEAKASLKQGMWEEYINGLSDLSQEQKDYVLDNVKFWQMMPADSGAYQKAKNAGYDTPEAIQALLEAKSSFSTDGNNDINNAEMYKGIIGQTSDPAEQEKMYNAIKDKDAKKSWKELAAEQSKQQQTESAAQAALDKAVSKDKQTAFATAMENATGTKQTDCYRALTSTGASEAECKAYFAYLSAQKGWKKSWEKVKADALKGK